MYGVVDAEEDVRGVDAGEERGREGKEQAEVDGEEEKGSEEGRVGSERLCPRVVTELGVGRGAFYACAAVWYCVCVQVTAKVNARREWVAVRASDQRMAVVGDGIRG